MSASWAVDPDATDADAPDGTARIVDAAVAQDSSAIAAAHIVWAILPREQPTIARRLWYWLQCALHLLARLVAGVTALARDLCESAYASYPSEAEDGFSRALAESRPEQ